MNKSIDDIDQRLESQEKMMAGYVLIIIELSAVVDAVFDYVASKLTEDELLEMTQKIETLRKEALGAISD